MKTITPRAVVAALFGSILILAAPFARAAESLSLLLQKAIYAEETEGNLDSAIKIYEQIAAEGATNRALIAQAQYRLAVCYQKMGRKEEAVKVLNDLIHQTASGSELAAKIRRSMAELGVTVPEAISVRRIPMPSNADYVVAVSGDGRLVAFQTAQGKDLWVHDVATGKSTLVADNVEMWAHSPPAHFSPDGEWIAYEHHEADIHVAKVDGTEQRKLFAGITEKVPKPWNAVGGWSRDGTQVIMARWDHVRACRVAVAIDAKSGDLKEIAPVFDYRGPDQWTISRDGRYVARRAGDYPKAIRVLDFHTRRQETIVDSDADRVIGWTHDGRALVYAKTGPRGIELWRVGMHEGKAFGAPALIFSDSGGMLTNSRAFPLGITTHGRIFYVVGQPRGTPPDLLVIEGSLPMGGPRNLPASYSYDIPKEELVRAGQAVQDKKWGLDLTLPAEWSLARAGRTASGLSFMGFKAPEFSGSWYWFQIGYWSKLTTDSSILRKLLAESPKPTTHEEVDTWLMRYATLKAEHRIKVEHYASYVVQADSFVRRTINGNRALTWRADYVRNNKPVSEYVTAIYGENLFIQPFVQAESEGIDAAHRAFDRLVESIRSN